MRIKGWIKVLALVLAVFAAFSALESVVCAEDADTCCEESVSCCPCVHTGVAFEAPVLQPFFEVSFSESQVSVAMPTRGTEPLFRPPIV
jgi:hypothetical protein